ncbi:Cytochrome P450 [Mycena sanguinolenta]|uniref:Cytochrome P450 n=1 Tax=Mycena sanguinolenta TaxID=230812 RepID=A0A8H6YZX2_9AGAR|nr:Cytochrome P450 [Mycena sanguinolenta]
MEYTLITLAALPAVFVLWFAFRRRSVLRTIPGPLSPSWIYGNMLEFLLPPTYGQNEFAWQEIYGKVYRIRGCFGQQRLVISDPLALGHIIKSPNFHHAQRKVEGNIALYGAKSIPSLQGEEHRRLRAGLSVGFTAAAVSEYQTALERIAAKASDELEASSGNAINVCPMLGNAALAAATELAFGGGELDEELVGGILKIMPRWPGQSKSEILIDGIGARFPIFFRAATLYLRSFKLLRQVQAQATRVGRQILRERAAAMESGSVDLGHDLYSRLLSNTSSNKRKLTDDEITAQTSVLLVAGHETTANTLAFGLLELARNPEFQQKLREELNTRQENTYDSLPLLNAFVKELLRVYPAAALRERVALRDDIIPLSEGIVTTAGQHITQIPIRKGDQVVLALASYQRLPSLWGDDADVFNPYRWIEGRVHQGEAIGPYANLLSFFGGPHVCPGWRFAVLEMQVILSTLIHKFSFTIPENETIRVKLANTIQPTDASGQKCVRLCVVRNLEHV